MDREQLIECMAKATYGGRAAWEGADEADRVTWRSSMRKALDALTAAGMVVVNATPTDAEIEKISEGMGWTGDEPTIRMWVECLIREMREAANAGG